MAKPHFDVVIIIPFEKRTVNDVEYVALVVVPVFVRQLHRNIFQMLCKRDRLRQIVFLREHVVDRNLMVFFKLPEIRGARVLVSACVRYVEYIAQFGRVAGGIQKRDSF